eukprot:Skav218323  [mRNA]  locus=scaffold2239:222289:225006:+ [translate_table: standard]
MLRQRAARPGVTMEGDPAAEGGSEGGGGSVSGVQQTQWKPSRWNGMADRRCLGDPPAEATKAAAVGAGAKAAVLAAGEPWAATGWAREM